MNDFLYEAPPLVEVIAEIHWQVQKLVSIPDGGIDPFYAKCLDNIRRDSYFAQYRHEEHLVPDQVPIEFFANKPIVRFLQKPNSWPLFQLGPGIFVLNLVPPYNGWNEFRSMLALGLGSLLANYPDAMTNLRVSRLELKYIDAFKKQHGLDSYARFVSQELGMSLQVPSTVLERLAEGNDRNVITASNVSFPLTKPANSNATLSVGLGKASGEDAVIAQFSCAYQGEVLEPRPETLLAWFDEAHLQLREWFELQVSEVTKSTFGEKKNI